MPPNNAVPAKTPELKIDLKATTVLNQVAGTDGIAKLLLGDGVEIAAFLDLALSSGQLRVVISAAAWPLGNLERTKAPGASEESSSMQGGV